MHVPRLRLLASGLAASALLFAGCVGDEADSPTDAEGEPTATATTAPETVRVASPSTLESYRYEVAVTALLGALGAGEAPPGLPLDQDAEITITGERVNPDREHATSSVDLGFLSVEVETVRVGDQQWVREGTRPWTESAGGGMDILGGMDFRPAALFTEESEEYEALAERLAAQPYERTTLDGMPVLHFTFTEEQFFEVFEGQGDIVPQDVEATLAAEFWLSEELGTPVRLIVTGADATGAEVLNLQMDLRDMNDDSIEIETPV